MRLLVRNATHAWLGPDDERPGCSLLAEDGLVVRVGTADATWPAADETLDAGDCLLLPGLVNTHHHLYQTLTRAFAPALRLDLFGWLRTLYPVWARLDAEAVYESAWVGLAELLLSGCTTSSDHLYLHPRGQERLVDAEIRAARELGIRFTATRGSMSLSEKDGGLPPDSVVQDDDAILADSERVVREFHDATPGAMVQVALAPCSPFTVTPDLMTASAELARSLGVRLHTHLAETQNENEYCAEVYGCTPYELAARLDWLAPDVWLAHAVWTSAAEAALLGATGTGVAHCPTSNMVLGAGVFPTTTVLGAGGHVGLGCDGSASNDASNIWQEVRQSMLLAKLRSGANEFSARDALTLATVGGAAVLGRTDIGRLAPGMCADLVCIPLDGLSTAGAALDPVEAAVRCAVPGPRHVVVAGAVKVRDGVLTTPGLDAHAARHRTIAKEWAAAAVN